MKDISFVAALLCFSLYAAPQNKPIIDTGMLGTWPYLIPQENKIALSSNGNFVSYIVGNYPIGFQTLYIKSLHNNWERSFVSKDPFIHFFSADNRHLCWQSGDSLFTQELGKDKKQLLSVTSEVSHPQELPGTWLLIKEAERNHYKLIDLTTKRTKELGDLTSHTWVIGKDSLLIYKTGANTLTILNLKTYDAQSFSSVEEFSVSTAANKLLMFSVDHQIPYLSITAIDKINVDTIWSGSLNERPNGYLFDPANTQLAFNIRSRDGKITMWHYNFGHPASELPLNDLGTNLAKGYSISGARHFSRNGKWLFFSIRKSFEKLTTEKTVTAVNIWSYRDETIYPAQAQTLPGFRDYMAVVELATGKVQLLETNENTYYSGNLKDYVLLETGRQKAGPWWPFAGPSAYWLYSLKDRTKKLIKQNATDLRGPTKLTISPSGRWVCYWDPVTETYYFFDPETGKEVDVTEKIKFNSTNNFFQAASLSPVGIAGWYAEDTALLIYDNFDIWEIDPSGKKLPVNITTGYGKNHHIIFDRVNMPNETIAHGSELLLSGFNTRTKENGFFSIKLGYPENPRNLTMGPYLYYQERILEQSLSSSMKPLTSKTTNKKIWVVMRQSSTEYPNYYFSKDNLQSFTPLTSLQPQKNYNWLTSEPVRWRMYNGEENSGVLYKPDNFDSTKKYPVIFNYYEKYAQRCYEFPTPDLTGDNINIPWFVSRGYLVFTPDIQYIIANKPGGMSVCEAAYNSVASAADFLSKRSYVDSNHLAIQGHSFGGLETNGIITYTNKFAAAAEAAGYSDHISTYLSLTLGDETNKEEKEHKIDHHNQRMGASLWDLKEQFLRNSPVYNADRVTTPLLIMHNKTDGSINFRQGIEMYMALRRLSKPCWLLQYDSSGHVLANKHDALDYTIRLTQYFDHYLKGARAPLWMTINTLKEYKNKNNLFALDFDGYCSITCKVCKKWSAYSDKPNRIFGYSGIFVRRPVSKSFFTIRKQPI